MRIGEHHCVIDACELFYIKGNGNIRVYKGGKALCDSSVHYLYRPDLNDLIFQRAEAGGFYVKNHIGILKALSFGIFHQLLCIVYQISLYPVDDLKGISLIQSMVCIRKGLDTAVIRHRD